MAAGILVLLSLCLCYCCNRRAEKERGMQAYAKTFDDGESSIAESDEGHNNRDVASRVALFANPEHGEEYDSDKYSPTDVAPTDEEEEYPIQPRRMPMDGTDPDPEQASNSSPVEDMLLHDKGEVCSSPTCRLCEDRRREGLTTPSARNYSSDQKTEYPARGYIQDDTVEL